MLRHHRHAARLTLEQLAEASGVSARTLSDMERGRSRGPQHRTVTALAAALGLADADREQLVELAREGRLRDHWTRPTGLCELPRSVDDFTGRAAELAWTHEVMRAGDTPGAAGVALVTGSAGLGKTTLTVRAAHALRPDFPQGVFFLDLFGMSPHPLPVEEALGLLLRALGVAEQQLPGDVAGRASLYRSLLRDRRVLIVLDNAASEEQTRPLLPGGGAGRALVTSRRLLAGLEGVRRLGLGPLPPPEATELLTGILRDRGASDEGSALWQLAQLCGGLPLALRIAGNRLASRPGWNAADLAARLTNEERRLDQLSAGDLRIATAFGLSYEQLPDPTRRVFRRLALVPGRDFDAALAAVVGGTPIEGAWDALDELVDLGLLQDGTSGRYRFHDLVRLFARDRLREEDAADEREALTVTMTSWLLRMATTAGRWFEPAYGRPDRPDPDLAALSSAEEAGRWLRVNVDNWLGALRHVASAGGFAAVLDCAESMHWFSDRWMHAPHWHEVFTLGAEAAAALGEPARQAAQLNLLAWVHLVPRDDMETTLRYTAQALDLATRSGATGQVALAHHHAGGALRRLGRLDEAIAAEIRAAEMFRADGDVDRYCHCLGALGTCLRDAGRHGEALEQYLDLWALLNDDRSGMTPSVAAFTRPIALARVGECLGLLGHRSEAIGKLTEAIALMEQAQLPVPQARSLETLAALLSEEGRTGESRRAYARAAEVYEAVGDAEASGRCHDLANAAP
ncbi:helix-turn-helix domain-containing protein [Sphaerisporangium sp. TRM90804]|uniref:helix-turn-helix domain-containing protein n=1 Tax=Sphaerisporangium sp. TRM90804 TaxID=3031113 RepID=UPI00244B8C1C|nr:helix-turn-helix domain-containing protein [Sphaerisporangium sp. TRM90804]MDH2426348.1 helix-turn-helix domain-containing protein [Sphaerisporangium sp. TRM90804]